MIEITEYALARADKTMSRIDDSSGWFPGVVTDLEKLHHDACETVRPARVALAQRLSAFEVDTEVGNPHPRSGTPTCSAMRSGGYAPPCHRALVGAPEGRP